MQRESETNDVVLHVDFGLRTGARVRIINVTWLEASYFAGELNEEHVRKHFQRGGRPVD